MKQSYTLKTGAELKKLDINKEDFLRPLGKKVKQIKDETSYVVGFDSQFGDKQATKSNINFFQPRSTFARTMFGAVICQLEKF